MSGTGSNPRNEPPAVLLVEDNLLNQLIASQILTKWGCQVSVAQDGKEALELIDSKGYQLVLMDIQMPIMDGCEAATRIRLKDDPYFKEIPIIAFTASTIADSKEKAMEFGMNDWLGKPINIKEFHAKLEQYLVSKEKGDIQYKVPKIIDRLELDFSKYSDLDEVSRQHIISLMILDIENLLKSLAKSRDNNDVGYFTRTTHKISPTLSIIKNSDLLKIIEEITRLLEKKDKNMDDRIQGFTTKCKEIVKGLELELERV